MSIYQQVIERGVEHANHSSDLYIPVNDETRALIAEYEHKRNVSVFKNNIDGKPWFDIPFAYDPFWNRA